MTDFTPLTIFLCRYSSHQALLWGDDTAGLFHPAPAAGRQHGWHFPGASLFTGHRPGANHSAQHQHNLHHWWVWQPATVSVSSLFSGKCCLSSLAVCQTASSWVLGSLQCAGRVSFLAVALWSSLCFFIPEKRQIIRRKYNIQIVS